MKTRWAAALAAMLLASAVSASGGTSTPCLIPGKVLAEGQTCLAAPVARLASDLGAGTGLRVPSAVDKRPECAALATTLRLYVQPTPKEALALYNTRMRYKALK